MVDADSAGAAVRKLEAIVDAMDHRRLIYEADQPTVITLRGMD